MQSTLILSIELKHASFKSSISYFPFEGLLGTVLQWKRAGRAMPAIR